MDDANRRASAPAALIVAHTSDLHLGGRSAAGRELASLDAVLSAAREVGAHALVLAGDVFDSHRAPANVVRDAARMIETAGLAVVILPGNHDPATADAVYRRDGMAHVANLHIIGVNADQCVQFPALDLAVTGVPHMAYADMAPLGRVTSRTMRWQIVVAHGHWVTGAYDDHRAWLIRDAEIAASGADYVALGHWDVPQPVGNGVVPAYYSGSPELARTINVVRFDAAGVDVRRQPLQLDR